MKKVFQIKKDFNKTCSELIKNELGLLKTRSDYISSVDIEQTSLAVFTAAFRFPHAEYNLIILKLE